MSENESNFDVNGNNPLPLDPALEARIVAWVAGEASPFEAAELERLVAEKPEAAAFKREMEAVQGLISVAVTADAEPLRLSAERRAKVMAAIGAENEAAKPGATAPSPRIYERKKRWNRYHWIWATAACLTMSFLLVTLTLPAYKKPARPDLAQTILGGEARDREQVQAQMMVEDTNGVRRERVLRRIAAKGASESEAVALSLPASEGAPTDAAPARPGISPAITRSNAKRPVPVDPRSDGFRGFAAGGAGGVADEKIWSARELVTDTLGQKPPANVEKGRTMPADPELAATSVATPAPQIAPANEIVQLQPFTVSADREGAAMASLNAPLSVTRGLHDLDRVAMYDSPALQQVAKDSLATGGAVFGAAPASSPQAAEKQMRVAFGMDRAVTNGIAVADASLDDAKKKLADATDNLNKFKADQLRADQVTVTTGGGALALDTRKDVLNEKLRAANLELNGALLAVERAKEAKLELKEVAAVGTPPTVPPPAAPVHAEAVKETNAAVDAFSTFSLHVSDVSFRLAQAALAKGERPDDAKIRAEEFYNAFDYGDPAPSTNEKIGCRIEQSAHPYLQQRNLVRLAMKVAATGRGAGQPLRLTVLLDTSGSMEREDRVEAVRRAMAVLVSLLGPNDRITLIGFARQPHLLADNVAGDQAHTLLDIVARTPAEGGTNLEEALKLGRELALRHRDPAAQNRLVVLTDGAANLGDAEPARLMEMVDAMRQQGLAFDACGVGLEGIGDTILEALTRKGNGRYYVLDSAETADAAFARQLAGAFRPAAENVKLQVRFNPARVGQYRLIGFDEHRLRTEDFRNDQVDAAELGAEEAANALYAVEVKPEGSGEIGEVFVRFRDAATGQMVERSWTIPYDPQAPAFNRATPSMQLAGVAALLAEKLQGSPGAANFKLRDLTPIVSTLRTNYRNEPRVRELAVMFEQLRRMSGE